MKTLTETIEFLEEAIQDVQHDITADWMQPEHIEKMRLQLQHLIMAKGCLDAIRNSGKDQQIFRSSIRF